MCIILYIFLKELFTVLTFILSSMSSCMFKTNNILRFMYRTLIRIPEFHFVCNIP